MRSPTTSSPRVQRPLSFVKSFIPFMFQIFELNIITSNMFMAPSGPQGMLIFVRFKFVFFHVSADALSLGFIYQLSLNRTLKILVRTDGA